MAIAEKRKKKMNLSVIDVYGTSIISSNTQQTVLELFPDEIQRASVVTAKRRVSTWMNPPLNRYGPNRC